MGKRKRLLKPAPVEQVADRALARTRRAFLDAIEIQRRGIRSADDALTSTTQLHKVVEAVTRVYWSAGQLAGQHLRVALQPAKRATEPALGFSFTVKNPKAVAWAKRNGARLVTETNEATKDAIRRIVALALDEGGPPREIATLIKPLIGLTTRQVEAAWKYRAKLIEAGRSAEQVARMAEKYAAKLLKARSEMIARTETMKAANSGQTELWKQARDEGYLPKDAQRVWIATEGACEICEELDETATGLDDPWPGGYEPPAHPLCRCAEGIQL